MSAFDQYPLVLRALEEMKDIFSGEPGGMPDELLKITCRTLEILDACLPYPEGEKESLMVAAVFVNCPPDTLPSAPQYFSQRYNDRVQSIMDTWRTELYLARDMKDLVQICSALYTAYCEDLLGHVRAATKNQTFFLEGLREDLEDHLKSRALIKDAIVPALDALELKAIREVLSAADAILKPSPRPKPYRKAGPGV